MVLDDNFISLFKACNKYGSRLQPDLIFSKKQKFRNNFFCFLENVSVPETKSDPATSLPLYCLRLFLKKGKNCIGSRKY